MPKTNYQTDLVRVWAQVPKNVHDDLVKLSADFGVSVGKLVSISIVSGYKSLERAAFPERQITPEILEKINEINRELEKTP